DEDARLRRVDRRDLVERHLLAVHLDADRVEHVGRRLARTHRGELVLDVRDVLVHGRAGVLENLLNGAHRTRVPTRSPRMAATIEPGRWMLRTINGSEFSRHNVLSV